MKKTTLFIFIYAVFSILVFNLTGCQDEFDLIPDENEGETINADSSTATLIANTSANDGSFDNIVDESSCFAINFPYTVEANDVELTINSIEDLRTIEEIFDAVDVDVDILEILFPITITFADFSELVIESKEQLRELAAECVEGGADDDIECIDFVYPISIATFDINVQTTGTITVENDRQMRRFFAGLEEGDVVSLVFPITLIKYDGTEIVVNNNEELAAAIEAAKDECDEDDDNDFNDDDFTKERLDAYLVECVWELRDFRREGIANTDQYFEYTFDFDDDGTVILEGPFGGSLSGIWETTDTENGVLLSINFDGNADFTSNWLVYEIEDGKIKLYTDNENRIILKQDCDDDDEFEPDALREILKQCVWVIKKVKNQGEEIDRLLGYEFMFFPDGVVKLKGYGETLVEGTWEVGYNNAGIISLLISIEGEGAVSFEWPLRDLYDDRLKFAIEEIGYELILQRVCTNAADGDVFEITNYMMGGDWVVANYTVLNDPLVEAFQAYTFDFNIKHEVIVSSANADPYISGLWRVLRNADGNLKFYLNFDSNDMLGELTETWYIVSVGENRLELAYEDENTTKLLVFEKNTGAVPTDCDQFSIISEELYENGPDDDVTIESVQIEGDCLKIVYTASGCDGESWEVDLFDAGVILESFPPQRNLRLALTNNEACDAVITKTTSFDISNLRVEEGQVQLNITNSDDSILYEYE